MRLHNGLLLSLDSDKIDIGCSVLTGRSKTETMKVE